MGWYKGLYGMETSVGSTCSWHEIVKIGRHSKGRKQLHKGPRTHKNKLLYVIASWSHSGVLIRGMRRTPRGGIGGITRRQTSDEK
jgi:hypothetical protein